MRVTDGAVQTLSPLEREMYVLSSSCLAACMRYIEPRTLQLGLSIFILLEYLHEVADYSRRR